MAIPLALHHLCAENPVWWVRLTNSNEIWSGLFFWNIENELLSCSQSQTVSIEFHGIPVKRERKKNEHIFSILPKKKKKRM